MDVLDTRKAILRARELAQLSSSTCERARELITQSKLLEEQIKIKVNFLQKLKAQHPPADQASED